MVGLDDLRGLFQTMILWFYDFSEKFCHDEAVEVIFKCSDIHYKLYVGEKKMCLGAGKRLLTYPFYLCTYYNSIIPQNAEVHFLRQGTLKQKGKVVKDEGFYTGN